MKTLLQTRLGRRLGVFGLLVALMGGVHGAEAPDLSAPDVQELRQEWLDARAALENTRKAELSALLAQQLQSAKEQLARARVSGNMTQQAVARAALQLFEQAAARFQKDGLIDLPEKARREVQPVLDAARRSMTGIDAVRDAGLKSADRDAAVRLHALLKAQGVVLAGDSEAEALLPRLAAAAAPVSASGGNAAEGGVPEAGVPPEEAPKPLGSTGEAEAWMPLMNIGAQVAVLEVVSVPVVGVASERASTGIGVGSQQEIAVRVVPFRVLANPKAPVVFRAMTIPGKLPVDIMTWPSERNGWTVEFRCRPKAGGTHAFLLEVAEGTVGLAPVTP